MKTITIRNDTVGHKTIPISDIDCLYHDIVKRKPVIILRVKKGVIMTIFYWGEKARLIDWKAIKKELEGEYFADFDNLVFRPEIVSTVKKGMRSGGIPYFTINFLYDFECTRNYPHQHAMEHEHNRLMRILAQSKALLESLKMPHAPDGSKRA